MVDEDLSQRLPRHTQRQLTYTGSVESNMPTLASQATQTWDGLMREMRHSQVVVWLDNWYCERYGVDPERPVTSTDLSAVAVLVLSSADLRPADRTRSHSLPQYQGSPNLHHLTIRVDQVAEDVCEALDALNAKVDELMQHPPQRTHIRVPLDIQRPSRPSLRWRPLTLSENRVSTNVELLQVINDLLQVRDHTANVLPLLVDEKVHYAILRMQLARSYSSWYIRGWMKDVPVLYGVCT